MDTLINKPVIPGLPHGDEQVVLVRPGVQQRALCARNTFRPRSVSASGDHAGQCMQWLYETWLSKDVESDPTGKIG